MVRQPGVPVSYPFLLARDQGRQAITTTIFVQMVYVQGEARILREALVIAIPNGRLQDRYAPTADDTIWRAGKHSPRRGEDPRTRISIEGLKAKAAWRVQQIRWDAQGAVECSWVDVDQSGNVFSEDIIADRR